MATVRNLVKPLSVSEGKPKRVLAPVWEGVEYPHHTPGVYDIRCNEIQGPEWLKNHRRWSIRLECHFLMDEGVVSGFLNLGDDPKQCNVRRQSNYFKLWCKVNGGLPQKGQAMDWNDFIGKFFRVRIEDASKNSKGEPLSEVERYSKIVEFLDFIGP